MRISLPLSARRLVSVGLASLCAVVGVLAFAGAPAQAASARKVIGSFGPAGLGSGAFSNVTGVAVEQSSHDVYVYDAGAGGRIYKFDAAGEPQKFSSLPANVIEGVGGYGSGESEIAVDSSSGPDKGDIYVATFEKVEIYSSSGASLGTLTEEGLPSGVAVDPSGDVYVAFYEDQAVKKYNPLKEPAKPVSEGDYESSLSGIGEITTIAVDSAGDVYVTTAWEDGPVIKYAKAEFNTEGTAALFGTKIDSEGATLAVDPSSGDVYIDEKSDIAVYSGTTREEEFGSLSESYGVAVDHESGDVYASAARGNSEVVIYGPLAVFPTVTVGSPTELHGTSVTLNGTVNPEATSVTKCVFEYGTSTSYGQSEPCSKAVPFTGNSAEAVSANVTGLQSGTVYDYRLAASNANGTETAAGSFTTANARVEEVSVVGVSSSVAELRAQIDPLGVATSYYFQYGTASCAASPGSCTDVPAAPGEGIGAGTVGKSVVQQLQGLAPSTTYYYDVVTVQGSEAVAGVEHTFTTQPAAGGFVLPDGRQWEMVSPLDKNGAVPSGISETGSPIQASEAGGGIVYDSGGPLPADGEIEGLSGNGVQNLSVRDGVDGWVSQNITPPISYPGGLTAGHGSTYRLFSSDLALGLVRPVTGGQKLAEPPLSPAVLPGEVQEKTLWLRADAPLAPEESEAASYATAKRNGELMGNAGFLALVDAQNAPGIATAQVEPLGATPNLAHGVFAESEIGDKYEHDLYEWSAGGEVSPVSVLPGQTSEVKGVLGGGEGDQMTRHAISNDGALVFWSELERGATDLYVRDTETSESLKLDTVQGGSGSGVEKPFFWTASAEGSRVFFTDEQQLTAGSKAASGKADLYESELTSGAGKPPVGTLSDLAPGGEVQSVLGASEDGAYVYFVADGVLGDGAERGATQGSCEQSVRTSSSATCSLYVYHDGATTFIATLSQEDAPTWGEGGGGRKLTNMTSRVSPDGQYLAFMSDRSLTGYDNVDANSGVADEEVFLYQASGERLVCASCDPTGARPEGEEDGAGRLNREGYGGMVDASRTWTRRWLAGSVPGWTPDFLGRTLYQSRYLSDSGRLFFNSPDHLVPAATSAKEKVYEYEPSGVGSCQLEAGCVGLISPGDSEHEEAFLDANASGSEVFFLTDEKLVPQDTGSARDVYVAHECTSSSPCPPAEGAVPPACTTAESCRAAPAPQPEIFGAPPSQTFSGAGNITPPANTPPAVGRVKVLGHSVHGTTITLKVSAPGKGTIVAYGAGLQTTKHRVGGAVTYTLKVALSARARASVERLRRHKLLRHKRKLTVRVRFVPTSGKASQTSVLAMVKA